MNKIHRRVFGFVAAAVCLALSLSTIMPVANADGTSITDKNKFSTWTVLGPSGGDVRAVEIDPKNKDRVFITTLDGQIYVSNNAGGSWQLLASLDEPELVLDQLMIDPRDSNVIYASGHRQKDPGGFFKSTDGGKSWKESKELRSESIHSMTQSDKDPNVILVGALDGVWMSKDSGDHWEKISPDLSRPNYELPASIGKYKEDATKQAHRRGVIYAVAPSPLDANRIWCGTDDGLIHLTTDAGKTWSNVTPPSISAWQKISVIEAGHFDANTAYAAVNTLRIDDLRPHIFATHDSGRTWTEIVNGIPAGQIINAIREDPERKGLLFAAAEKGVYVSFDDGANWESLRLNLPATSVRDLIVKGDDLVVGTHGRGFWILDNITLLRQFDRPEGGPTPTSLRTDGAGAPPRRSNSILFKPQKALRVRANLNTDTPLPPDEPAGENPPDGAMIDYFLSKDASGPITIEITDGKGQLIRKHSSADKPVEANPKRLRIPTYWIQPPQLVSTKAGMHRFLWDMHYTPIAGVEPEFPISATYRNTAPQATSPWVAPGDYTVTLTIDNKTFSQPLTVAMDPRVKASAADLQEQFDLSWKLYQLRLKLAPVGVKFDEMTQQLTKLKARAAERPDVTQKLEDFVQILMKFGPPHPRPGAPPSFFVLDSTTHLFDDIQGADAAPTAATKAAAADLETKVRSIMDAWRKLLESDLPALNQQLKQAGFPEIKTESEQLKR